MSALRVEPHGRGISATDGRVDLFVVTEGDAPDKAIGWIHHTEPSDAHPFGRWVAYRGARLGEFGSQADAVAAIEAAS